MPYKAFPIPGFNEPFSSLSHLLAAVSFLFFSFPLLRKRPKKNVIALGIFAISCIFLLSMSGVFHLLPRENSGSWVLQKLDHAGIFILIAGSFTPVHVILFRGFWRWGILLMIWSLAIIGLVLKMIFFNEIPESIGISVYLGLGWLGAFSFLAISSRFGLKFVLPLLLGAVFYTIGAVLEFSGAPILIAGVIGSHEIFHIAVIIAIGFHWQFMARIASIESPPLPTVTGVIEEETVDASTLPEYKASTDSLST